MEIFSALLALCDGNPPVTGGFPSQRPVTRSFDIFFLCVPEQMTDHKNRDAVDLRPMVAHNDVTVMTPSEVQFVNYFER